MRLFILSCALLFALGALPAWAAPPAAPSNVILIAPYVSTLKLSWQDNSNDETGFEISYRAGTSATFSSLGTVPANRTTLDLNGANPLTTYQFRIRSYLNPGPEYSAYAGPATVPPPSLSSPAAPRYPSPLRAFSPIPTSPPPPGSPPTSATSTSPFTLTAPPSLPPTSSLI
jgi:hypothetical protein